MLQRWISLKTKTMDGCPPLFYSVQRTSVMREAFRLLTSSMKYSSMELLSLLFLLLAGQAAAGDFLFGFRDYSSTTTRDEIRDDPEFYFTQADVLYIRGCIKPLLVEREGVTDTEAEFILNQIAPVPLRAPQSGRLDEFSTKLPSRHSSHLEGYLRGVSRLMPGLYARHLGFDPEPIIALTSACLNKSKYSRST
jgi:hypothetical protein